jgi:hypothetical protein
MDQKDINLRCYWEDNIYNVNVLVDFFIFNEKLSTDNKESFEFEFKDTSKKIAVLANQNIVVGIALVNQNKQIEKFSIINLFKNKEVEKDFKKWIEKQ